MNRKIPLAIAGLAALFLSLGMKDDGPKKDVVEVKIEDLQFNPDELTIKKGQTVRWINKDNRDHIIVAKDQSFKSENLRNGDKFEHKFEDLGTFEYNCAYRLRMTGQVTVEE